LLIRKDKGHFSAPFSFKNKKILKNLQNLKKNLPLHSQNSMNNETDISTIATEKEE
jgi:hypothetical protein